MDVKKLFVHVKATGSVVPSELHNAVITKSTGSGSDRIYFLEDTNELIVKGHAYGLSTTDAARIAALETGLTKATGVVGDAFASDAFTITDDSVIGKYVNKIAGVFSSDGTITVHKDKGQAPDLSVNIDDKSLVKVTDGENKGQISVGLDNIIDGATIVKDGDKIKSGLKLVYVKRQTTTTDGQSVTSGPYLELVDSKGNIVDDGTANKGKVDVSDFIVDGLLQDVKYNEATHTIDFTWNTDTKTEEGKPKPKTASVDISKLFNIEQLHTTTPTYLTVNTVTSNEDGHPHTGDVKGGRCFDVDAVVDAHDYNTTFALTHTPASPDGATVESYAKRADDTATEQAITGLADAKKVANAVKYLVGQIVDLGNDRIAAEKKNADAIVHETETARAAEKENKDAIAKLNSNADIDGSVAHSIKTTIDSLDSEVKGVAAIDTSSDATKEATKLVSVKVTQTDGKLTGVAVEAKIASLVVPVNDDSKVDYKKDTISVAARGLTDSGDGAKDGIASLNPALVTLQDAWLYGQCIKAQAVKEIASDNNDYIHISRADNQTKIDFEPWVEVHTADEINAL